MHSVGSNTAAGTVPDLVKNLNVNGGFDCGVVSGSDEVGLTFADNNFADWAVEVTSYGASPNGGDSMVRAAM